MASLTKENVQQFCRTCLKHLSTRNEQTLTEDNTYHIDHTHNLSKWLEICKPLEEDMTHSTNEIPQEEYPQFLCHSCYESFKKLFEFKEMVENSYSILTELLATKECDQYHFQESITLEDVYIKSEPLDDNDSQEKSWDMEEENYVKYENDFITDEEEKQMNFEEMRPKTYKPDSEKDTILKEQIKLEDTVFIESSFSNGSTSPQQLLEDEEGQPKATKSFKCMQCNISYVHKYTYIAHIRQMHLGIERAFECELCHKKYTKFCNLYRHMRLEHNESLRQFKCEYNNCNRSFRQLSTRRKHYEKFHNHKPLPNQIEQISQEYLRQEEIKNSKVCKFSTADPLATASTVTETEIQTTLLPSNKRVYICPICANAFETSYNLKVHMNDAHLDEMKFACHICGKQKISKMKLDEHIATVHHNPTVTCNICQKVLKSKSHMRQHVLSVHIGVKPFACEYCPSTFAAKNTLKVHTRLHTGEKPFKCSICDRRFTQLTPMKKHLKTHDNGRTVINHFTDFS